MHGSSLISLKGSTAKGDRAPMTLRWTFVRTVLGRVGIAVSGTVLAISVGSGASAYAAGYHEAAQCTLSFSPSATSLPVGQALILTWSSVGATKLTGSWTQSPLAPVGAITTTRRFAGSYSYMVTGYSGNQYCGASSVQVQFLSAGGPAPTSASSPSAPRPGSATSASRGIDATSAARSGPAAGAGGRTASRFGSAGGSADSRNGSRAAGAGKLPTQSPTGGSGVAWLARPANLAALAELAVLGAVFFWKRETIRAAFVRQH
jgi:hypothetical protein